MTTNTKERIRYCASKTAIWMIPTTAIFTFMFLLLRDFLVAIYPYSYIVVIGMMAAAVVMYYDFAGAKYDDVLAEEEMTEEEKKNWDKFYRGQLCEVIPVEATEEVSDEGNIINYNEFVANNQKHVAVLIRDKWWRYRVLVYHIYIKNGDAKPERTAEKITKSKFFRDYVMADNSPQEAHEVELQVKIINP